MSKPVLKVDKTDEQVKQEQRQVKLSAIANKKSKGNLVIADISDQLDVIIDMLTDLLQRR